MRRKQQRAKLAAACLLVVCLATPASADIDLDEEVILFPTYATLDPERGVWQANLHVWVYEPEEDDQLRLELLNIFADALDLDPADGQQWDRFTRRGWGFVVDNERGQTFDIEIAGESVEVGPTGSNGHARSTVEIPLALEGDDEALDDEDEEEKADERARDMADGELSPRVDVPFWDDRIFSGRVELISPEGVSIISDIDDTIKISQVHDTDALLRRTFLLPHEPVPGMAALYQRWESQGAEFHYVTASPWQLYPTLIEFIGAEGFPRGSMHMRSVRLKDRTVFELFKESGPAKQIHIERILADFPQRRFVLIGDSAEQDPETFAAVARAHPGQIATILIRNVTEEGRDAPRYTTAFEGLDRSLWRIFTDPAEVADIEFLDEEPR